ncbi:MAG TPA: hypothetical protein VLK65_28315 [Vicinamibacteria bacterium]|nr:hypothetical protein [Vicinamibacteria bacterium]
MTVVLTVLLSLSSESTSRTLSQSIYVPVDFGVANEIEGLEIWVAGDEENPFTPGSWTFLFTYLLSRTGSRPRSACVMRALSDLAAKFLACLGGAQVWIGAPVSACSSWLRVSTLRLRSWSARLLDRPQLATAARPRYMASS